MTRSRDYEKWREWQRTSKPLTRKSRLRSRGRLKRRGVMEAHEDDPDRYGDLFLAVREEPCFGRRYLPNHECGIGVAPPSAHHLGEKDSDGLVPVCGRLHDRLEEEWWGVEEELAEVGSPTLEEIGQEYVEGADG